MVLPSGFIKPCQPSMVARPPSGPLWVHEIKHDGYRLMVRRSRHHPAMVAERGRWLRRTLKAEHACVPCSDGEPVGFLAGVLRSLCRRPDGCAVNPLA
jgi:hypothetical protein